MGRAAAPAPAAKAAPEHAEAGIAWRQAANDAEVDAAFASARSENKPVFVYWGAKWCPPCNQVKATLFNRQDFIERSRAFVPNAARSGMNWTGSDAALKVRQAARRHAG